MLCARCRCWAKPDKQAADARPDLGARVGDRSLNSKSTKTSPSELPDPRSKPTLQELNP